MYLPPILYRWLALAALVGIAMLYAAMRMHAHDAKESAAFVAQVKAEGAKQLEHTATIITQQKAITNETANDYAAGLIALRRDYDNKLRAYSNRGNVPAVSQSTGCPNATAADAVSAAESIPTVTPELCAETTLQLVKLQSWIIKQAGNK